MLFKARPVKVDSQFLLLVPTSVPLMLLAIGVISLVVGSFTSNNELSFAQYQAVLARKDYIETLYRTIWLAGLTTSISLLISYPTAYWIARYPGRRDIFLIILMMPWLVSVVVRTYGWIVILGKKGVISQALMSSGLIAGPLEILFSPTAIVIGLVHVFSPFMILAIVTVLIRLDKSLEEAAASLGAGPFETFRRVLLPLSFPGIVTGSIIVFLMSMGSVVTPLLLGSMRDKMLGAQIYQDVFQLFNFPKAAALAMILCVAALAVVLPLQLLEARAKKSAAS
ncbi:ABC transporter permease (plasmid) [Bradyrhizobium sp. CCBAU 53351]|nr:ABC transporter permease [Bradyrhizobium guangdongense]QAU51190.1 ABC transporter permease [Bradyrhizobium guangzhouense]QOZ49834.1 ABC transporter permease [Bradyrhizobium sp. CCBAU 53340]QOZ57280.1 ABC transporter permease [Bradyrhizobium sp. CCBAU 53338]QOZ81527.1 ABC transporter permease [Bradyrhizobium sp. CCBAU 53351]